jgi:hypothetical protein
MNRKQQETENTTEVVEVRNAEFEQETNGLIDVWRGKQKARGRKFKRGEAVVELTKIGLKAEGIKA